MRSRKAKKELCVLCGCHYFRIQLSVVFAFFAVVSFQLQHGSLLLFPLRSLRLSFLLFFAVIFFHLQYVPFIFCSLCSLRSLRLSFLLFFAVIFFHLQTFPSYSPLCVLCVLCGCLFFCSLRYHLSFAARSLCIHLSVFSAFFAVILFPRFQKQHKFNDCEWPQPLQSCFHTGSLPGGARRCGFAPHFLNRLRTVTLFTIFAGRHGKGKSCRICDARAMRH